MTEKNLSCILLLASLSVLLTAFPVQAGPPGPDNPRNPFWFRNSQTLRPETEAQDKESIALQKVFEEGRLPELRTAEAQLLATPLDPRERATIVSLLVTAHLTEGNYQTARRLAQEAAETERPALLAQILSAENTDRAETLRRKTEVENAAADAVAPAQLRLAEWHHCHGRREAAASLYGKLLTTSPDHPSAATALSHLIALQLDTSGQDAALRLAETMLERHADSRLLARAASRSLAWIYFLHGDTGRALQALQRISAQQQVGPAAEEAALALVEATYGHIHGAAGALDTSKLNQALSYVEWALERLPQGPARTQAYFHAAWYARWQSAPEQACLYGAKALAFPGLDTRRAAEAALLLELSLPSENVRPALLAWIAIAAERVGRDDWFGLRPTRTDSWQTLLPALLRIAHGAAADSAWAQLAAAECLIQAGDPAAAIPQLQLLAARWPHSPESRVANLRLAPLLTRYGRTREASALCEDLLKQSADPQEKCQIARELARALLCEGRGRASLNHYDHIIASDPHSPEAERAASVIADLARDCVGTELASDWLSALRASFPNTPVAAMSNYELVRLQTAQGLTASHAQSFLAILRASPRTLAAAQAASALEQGAPAIIADLASQPLPRSLHLLAETLPDLAPYLANVDASAHQSLSDLLRSAINSYPPLIPSLRPGVASLADAMERASEPRQLARIRALLGEMSDLSGDMDAACSAWEKAALASPDSPAGAQAALRLGDARLARHETDRAIAAYQIARSAASSLSPEQRATAMVGLGNAFLSAGRTEEAAYEFTAALALAPDSQAAARAEKALATLRSAVF